VALGKEPLQRNNKINPVITRMNTSRFHPMDLRMMLTPRMNLLNGFTIFMFLKGII